MSVKRIKSPFFKFSLPQESATRLIDSVALFVKIISEESAPIKLARFFLLFSYALVAFSPSS